MVRMTTLENITEHLLNRAQEAVLQLELWISQEQNLQQPECYNRKEDLKDTYSIYVAQLNSLCVRSEYVMSKLNQERTQRPSNYTNRRYIEDLVYEFQDVTTRLNDLALLQKKDGTPSSKSSKCSWDSFQPKPLKITERHRSHMEATQLSPIRKDNKKKVVIFSELQDSPMNCSKCVSLPGSPLKEANKNTVRLAKSYDTGLNGNSTSRSAHSNKNDVKSFFKGKQRISISLFEDCEMDEDSMSDQDTVISINFRDDGKSVPLRRYNSHESILSVKKQPSVSSRFQPSPFPSRINGPSMKSVRISSEPVFSRASKSVCSRQLLSEFVKRSQGITEVKEITENSSFFTRWNPFSTKPAISKEVKTSHDAGQKITASQALKKTTLCDLRSELKFVSQRREPAGPVLDSTIAYDDLREALNTDLIL
ncbi:hypothetical protein HG535_0A00220 [Zygotorulaspora mrakii]|uniref:Uncharacterized protein n=1 Tax=Zygotorulaspora mrakii TaxID=42260 RepID=A0A7H9AWW6_ZYGMR|nr:uncharacterized protein HG535_0A00220 [Zygotorulaspora mrakii]QLG70082.1 hypothetical protein HG535_0A00220 [Zygotorulaspora mrakii]